MFDYLKEIQEAIKNKQPYSFVRIGDGELVFLQQEYISPIAELQRRVGWSSSSNYCGAKLPNLELRDRLIDSLRNSNAVGWFEADQDMIDVFNKIGIEPKNSFYAFDNVGLPMSPEFVNSVLIKNKLLIVGQKSKFYADKLKEYLNKDVEGFISIKSYDEIDKCMKEMEQYDYDVALVSAGINANVICYEMSTKYNKVYLDMGHAWDNAFSDTYKTYWLIKYWQPNKCYQPNETVIYEDKFYQNISNKDTSEPVSNDTIWMFLKNL